MALRHGWTTQQLDQLEPTFRDQLEHAVDAAEVKSGLRVRLVEAVKRLEGTEQVIGVRIALVDANADPIPVYTDRPATKRPIAWQRWSHVLASVAPELQDGGAVEGGDPSIVEAAAVARRGRRTSPQPSEAEPAPAER